MSIRDDKYWEEEDKKQRIAMGLEKPNKTIDKIKLKLPHLLERLFQGFIIFSIIYITVSFATPSILSSWNITDYLYHNTTEDIGNNITIIKKYDEITIHHNNWDGETYGIGVYVDYYLNDDTKKLENKRRVYSIKKYETPYNVTYKLPNDDIKYEITIQLFKKDYSTHSRYILVTAKNENIKII